MACEVKTFASIQDLQKVQEFFGLASDETWLNAVQYAASPTSEMIAFALGEKLALLSSNWDNKSQQATFAPCWSGEIVNPNEVITSLLCLPMYGKSVSSGPEWTCIVVGLSSGYVNFYTDTGIKLFSQMFHDEAVLGVKCLFRHESKDSMVYAVYDVGVCMVKGDDIYPLLISKKNQVGNKPELAYGSKYFGELESPEQVPYQKFKYPKNRMFNVNDTVVAGRMRTFTYDHIVQQTLNSGLYAKFSEHPTQNSLVITVGTDPYLALFYAEEGYRNISVGGVAKDVIGIVYKNVFSGLFSSKATEKKPEEPPLVCKETTMRTGNRLYDDKRDGFNIWLAPGNQLAAIVDNFDRVMLIDCHRGTVLRVWKGYRDAQCAFIKVKEKIMKGDTHDKRRALFLVIYARHMGCLEIWGLQNGPKIAAFTVSKNGQLIYVSHGLVGVTPGARYKAVYNPVLFLDSTDQSLKEITIPFHYALREENSKTARDIHIFRRLRAMLRDDPDNCNLKSLGELCRDFQTDELRLQCVELMAKNKKMPPEFFQVAIHSFSCESNEKLEHLLEFYRKLTDFYIAMKNPPSKFDDSSDSETLSLLDRDLETLEQIMELLLDKKCPTTLASLSKVTFQVKHQHDGEFVEYLRLFKSIDGRPELNREKSTVFGYISEYLFSECFKNRFCANYFKEAAIIAGLSTEDLMVLVLSYWLEKPFVYTTREELIYDMMHLGSIVYAICDMAGDKVYSSTYNSICPWWQAVRELLLESPRSLSLMVAIVCKTVATSIRHAQTDGSCEENEEEKWEQISQDEAQWSLLIGKLDDIVVLGAILESPMVCLDPTMPELPYEPPDCSLKAIVTKGKGVVSDLTTKWLLYSRIHPSKIVEKEKISDDDESVVKRLSVLRRHFPFSLETGIILSSMAWEYMVHWSKDLQSLAHMRASLICLSLFPEADYALKHGMCIMIWNATIKYPLQSLMKLVQKVGRLPDDKDCQQDIGMPVSLLSEFLELCLEFLDHFQTSISHRKRELRFEDILMEGQLPLHFIALQRNHAIEEVLQLHNELCRLLQIIIFFQMKCPKPFTNLFDAMSNRTFFVEMNKELPYTLPPSDLVLQERRVNFLSHVVSSAIDLIREDLEQLYVEEHEQWMAKIYQLADLWDLKTEPLKRKQIIRAYVHGWDAYASELVEKFSGDEELGKSLLQIAGRRISLYCKGNIKRYGKVFTVGQRLVHYLDDLEKEPSYRIHISATRPEEIDLDAMTKLTAVAYKLLTKRESGAAHTVGQMYDACCYLKQLDKEEKEESNQAT